MRVLMHGVYGYSVYVWYAYVIIVIKTAWVDRRFPMPFAVFCILFSFSSLLFIFFASYISILADQWFGFVWIAFHFILFYFIALLSSSNAPLAYMLLFFRLWLSLSLFLPHSRIFVSRLPISILHHLSLSINYWKLLFLLKVLKLLFRF